MAGEKNTSGYYRDEFGRLARFYDTGLRMAFWLVGGEEVFRRAVVAAADIHPGHSVLDVNCGTGTLVMMLSGAAGPEGSVTGTDLADKMLAVARAKDTSSAADFVHANAEDLPFDNSSFDRVTATLAIHEMVREGRLNALAEIKRVLKDGGLAVVADLRKPDTRRTRLGMGIVRLGETDTLTDMWQQGLDREIEKAGLLVTSRQVAGKGFFEIIVSRK